jgi:2-oxoglutarate/2-oxoacid ferredoxin oxidoreductase subunit alpha
MKKLSIKIVGPAGFGIKVTGITIAKVFTRLGLNVFAYTEYPSLIRGGHNTYQIDVSKDKIHSSNQKCNILIGLTKDAINKEKNNIEAGGLVICDNTIPEEELNLRSVKVISAPLVKSAKFAGSELMKNTVALGVILSLLDLPMKILNDVLTDMFANKKEVIKDNKVASKSGYDWMEQFKKKENQDFDKLSKIVSVSKKGSNNVLMTGNQACAMSVIASECQMYVAYPMTPSTDILHILEAEQKETGMLIHQPEDEISGIHVALGSSFTGARSAVGTSGGGFALMNEGFSLAGMTETPLVVFEVMRPAPATGNPTWSDQGDLNYVVNAGHGEFAKVVIAPGTPEQSFDLVQHAFNLADKYQTPVVILSDKHLGESSFTVSKDVFDEIDKVDRKIKLKVNNKTDELFKRYLITKDGISPRPIPGTKGGEHIANSDEHDEYGYSDEASKVRIQQMDKRMKKLEEIQKEIPLPKVYGPKNASKTLVCWGSSFGTCKDSIEQMKNVNMIHFEYIYPTPKNLDKFLKKFKKLILVEQNKTGQLGKLIRQETGIEIKDKILKYDSRPFWSDELVKEMK